MFLCVWLYFKKFSEKYFLVFGKCYKEKDKTRKTNTAPKLTLNARLGSTAQCFASSSPTTAPSIAISRSTAPIAIGAKASSRSRIAIDGAGACERRGLELGACERCGLVRACFSLALSLSLSLRNSFEVKIGTKIHFRSQSLFFWVNGNQFLENSIFRTNQTPAFPKKYFRK